MKTMLRVFFCFFVLAASIYFYIDRQNLVTSERLKIPLLKKQLKEIDEKNARLSFEIERFESPAHLIELSEQPEFSHLKHPKSHEVLIVEEK